MSGDAHHITQPHSDERGAILAMNRALKQNPKMLMFVWRSGLLPDQDDLSLRRWKEQLLGSVDLDNVGAQHYGAIQGLAALGPNVVRLLILPNLEPHLKILEPELTFGKQKNIMKMLEAWQVYGTLLRAAGHCVHDQLKMFPVLPSVPEHTIWRNKGKVATTQPKKRKASTEQIDEQPPQKKTAVATDGPIVAALNNASSPSDMQIDKATTSVPNSDVSDINPSPSTQSSNENATRPDNNNNAGKRSINKSAILNQVWREELNSGQLLVSLSEQYGECVFPFIPTPEMNLFL